MWRVEYTTYNRFTTAIWRTSKEEADETAKGLRQLQHVSDVTVVDQGEEPRPTGDERFMHCARCGFGMRLRQMPASFTLDTDEPDNPNIWCRSWGHKELCRYRKMHQQIRGV